MAVYCTSVDRNSLTPFLRDSLWVCLQLVLRLRFRLTQRVARSVCGRRVRVIEATMPVTLYTEQRVLACTVYSTYTVYCSENVVIVVQ